MMWTQKRRTDRSWSWLRGAYVGALTAAAGLLFLTPLGGDLEEVYGLGALLQLRGPAPPPRDVVIVPIDRATAESLGLPAPPRLWPRAVHAKLVDALASRGASAIVFDLLFTEDGSEDDTGSLAQAMRAARNVVLLQGLERRSVSAAASTKGATPAQNILDITIDPIAAYRDSAVAIAPFPLPRDSARVTRFWTFGSGTDVPTMPSVALQLAARDISQDWAGLFAAEENSLRDPEAWRDRRIVRSMSELHHRLRIAPAEADRLEQAVAKFGPDKARRLSALLALYTGEDSRLLNLRGPPGTISMIPYGSLIADDSAQHRDLPQIKGKIVIVGLAEREVASLLDTYETAYSGSNGINLSGVEILATGLADLMENAPLKTSVLTNGLIVLGVAVVLGIAAASTSALVLAGVSFLLPFAVLALGYFLFVSAHLVIPVFTPTAVELPIGALLAALSLRKAEVRRGQKIDKAIRQYLPPEIVADLARGPLSSTAVPEGETRFTVCLETDVEGFTILAERLPPKALHELVNHYLGPLFAVVQENGGSISSVTGDAIMYTWFVGPDPLQARTRAIAATLRMTDLVNCFNAEHPATPLPTRFGLHAGFASFGAVGGAGHFAATLLGDAPNTASRIESANKQLRTRLLASDDMLTGVDGICARPLGAFLVTGRLQPVNLVEILAPGSQASHWLELLQSFARGIAAYDAENWEQAVDLLRDVQKNHPADGPTAFFLRRAEKFCADPPSPGSDRPIRLDFK